MRGEASWKNGFTTFAAFRLENIQKNQDDRLFILRAFVRTSVLPRGKQSLGKTRVCCSKSEYLSIAQVPASSSETVCSHFAHISMKLIYTATALTAATLAICSCSTAPTQKPRDRFAEADVNHDGRLSREEVARLLATKQFESLDTNKDGKLSMTEWNPTGNALDAKRFRAADTNHDGFVTLDEAVAYLKNSGIVTDFMKGADTNHDGYVSREEAAAYYAKHEDVGR